MAELTRNPDSRSRLVELQTRRPDRVESPAEEEEPDAGVPERGDELTEGEVRLRRARGVVWEVRLNEGFLGGREEGCRCWDWMGDGVVKGGDRDG
jgi:hypothetical protein